MNGKKYDFFFSYFDFLFFCFSLETWDYIRIKIDILLTECQGGLHTCDRIQTKKCENGRILRLRDCDCDSKFRSICLYVLMILFLLFVFALKVKVDFLRIELNFHSFSFQEVKKYLSFPFKSSNRSICRQWVVATTTRGPKDNETLIIYHHLYIVHK